jgi:raffinose/stachyose/melibiose transport system permease protein
MRRHGPSELRNEAYIFLFTVPCLVLYTLFLVTPIFLGFYYSLTNWNGIAPTFQFVGLKNFLMQLRDRSFHYSLNFTLTYALVVVPAAVLVSFFSALFLTTVTGRSQTVYKGFLFFPALLAPIVVSLIWKQIYTHALPWIGNALNIEFLKVSLMTNMKTLKGTIQVVHIWQAVALQTVLFVAGLQNIPEEIYDAARIDGAGFFQRLRYIVFPYIIPILNMVLILLLKQCLVLFDVIMGMTTGGPGSRTESLSVYIYKKAFETLQVGYATSVAVTVFFIMIIIATAQLNLLNKKDVNLQ